MLHDVFRVSAAMTFARSFSGDERGSAGIAVVVAGLLLSAAAFAGDYAYSSYLDFQLRLQTYRVADGIVSSLSAVGPDEGVYRRLGQTDKWMREEAAGQLSTALPPFLAAQVSSVEVVKTDYRYLRLTVETEGAYRSPLGPLRCLPLDVMTAGGPAQPRFVRKADNFFDAGMPPEEERLYETAALDPTEPDAAADIEKGCKTDWVASAPREQAPPETDPAKMRFKPVATRLE